jgi:multiple sugar transport system permease protein
MIYALLVSFTSWDGISSHWHWIGLANYFEALHDPLVLFSLGRTLIYTIIMVPVGVLGGLGLALLLNRPMPAIGVFRTIFYLPAVVPVVAAAIAWKLIFDRDTGALNALLEAFHGPTITWLVDPTAFIALLILSLWGIGGGMVISLAGLQGIPTELIEAARVDGARSWDVFFSVQLPLLTPVLFFQVVTGTIAALQTLVQPLLLVATAGVSGNAATGAAAIPRGNYLYMVNVYQQFFLNNRFGYGSALLWILFVIILLGTLLVFRSSNLWVYYEVNREAN